MPDYLPDELVAEILVRIPVESLIRFTSVCKAWYSLITSPSFISKHLNHSKTNTENLLLTINSIRECYLLSRGGEKLLYEFSELEPPFSGRPICCTRIVGNCDGLLCIVDAVDANFSQCIIVWNPLIRKSVTLPMPSKPQSSPVTHVFGFAVHPTTYEYMLVYIAYEQNDYEQKDVKLRKFPSKVELYTQGTGSWRSITSAGHPPHIVEVDCFQAYVGGAIHWIASSKEEVDGFNNLIMLFNMTSQAFSVMMMPAALVGQSLRRLSIMPYGETLAVLCRGQEGSCGIWVMKEYGVAESWAKLYHIDLPGGLDRVIGLRKNGKVMLSASDKRLLWYDCESKTLTNTGLFGSSGDTFMGSLVLLKPGNGVF